MSERIVESSRVLSLRFVECPFDGEKKLQMLIEEKECLYDKDFAYPVGGSVSSEWRDVPTVSYREAYPETFPEGGGNEHDTGTN